MKMRQLAVLTILTVATLPWVVNVGRAQAHGPLPGVNYDKPKSAPSPLPLMTSGGPGRLYGNPLIARTHATDDPRDFVVNTNAVLPNGRLSEVRTYAMVGSGSQTFHVYVLRPTGSPNTYKVVFDSGPLVVPAVASGQIVMFPIGPFSVMAGDVAAFSGSGIPLDQSQSNNTLIYPIQANPVVSATPITLGSASYPIWPTPYTFSFAVTVAPQGGPVAIGNPLIARTYVSDTSATVTVVNTSAALPAGQLVQVNTYAMVGSGPNAFNAYVLRPTGVAKQYKVVFDSGPLVVPAVASGQILTFPVGPFGVLAGDVMAFAGQGIPWDLGTGTDTRIHPTFAKPVVSATPITLGSAGFPIDPRNRTYSFGVTVSDAVVAP